jgi:anti-anti-sigma factor
MGHSRQSDVSRVCLARLECREREAKGITVIDLKGDLIEDETADEFHALLRRLFRSGKARLVLNLRHLGTLNISALCALLVDLVKIRQAGGDLALECVRPANMELLRRTGTSVAFRIFPSERAAVEGLSRSSS